MTYIIRLALPVKLTERHDSLRRLLWSLFNFRDHNTQLSDKCVGSFLCLHWIMNKKSREREKERERGRGLPCDTPPVLLPTNSQFRSENSEQTLHVKLGKTIGIKKRDDIRKKRMKQPFFAEVSEMLQERLGQKLTISFACLI